MVPVAPPAFEEAARCAVCGCSFGTFKRRHHCRACGRSLCNEHSSHQMALPEFGFPISRVCKDCFTGGHKRRDCVVVTPPEPVLSDEIDQLVPSVSALSLADTEQQQEPESERSGFQCHCGMPLCICITPEPPKAVSQAAPSVIKYKRVSAATKQPSTGSASTKPSPSLFFSSGQSIQAKEHKSGRTYDVTGEGIREAIKNGDGDAVKDLLHKGVNPNFTDKQGMSLLHLAAVFNLTEIAFMLMDAGGSVHARNSQGETPLDCAQTTLQFKLQQKLQEMDGSKGKLGLS